MGSGCCEVGRAPVDAGGLGCINDSGLLFIKVDNSQLRVDNPFSTLTPFNGRGFGLMTSISLGMECGVKLNKLSLRGRPESPLESDDADEPLEAAGSPGNGKAGLVVPVASGDVFA